MSALAWSILVTTGAVNVDLGCVSRQRGCPNEEVCPDTAILSFTTKERMVSGPVFDALSLKESGTKQFRLSLLYGMIKYRVWE